jgi:antirestriction protein ArdC
MEELVAELGAAFLCADLGITDEPRADHAQYIDHRLEVLKRDKKAIFAAASKASEAASFLAGSSEEVDQNDPRNAKVGVFRSSPETMIAAKDQT